ncbi:TPA: hypothetical protein IAD41_06325 [Candidatus Scatenecus faecavium]|uniref:Uncharacterized protein n=1 Tax=Candidatus Scatenecus faecavium TaxID=2840915 RepID=A0A9D1FW92_9BACT|nr:hypothetical protein [Candidatus Scatenecus faecavium]
MERVKVYVISALFVIMCLMPCAGVCEEPEPSLSTLITPQNVAFEDCTRTFNMNSDRLFYLTLAAVNANRFEIKEIQSKTGYVLFSAVGKEFLASIVSIDKYRSMLKITPANNNYFFAPGIVLNMYKYIDVNTSEHLQNIPKGG